MLTKANGIKLTNKEFDDLMDSYDFPESGTVGEVSLFVDLDELIKFLAENSIVHAGPEDVLPFLESHVRHELGNNENFQITKLELNHFIGDSRNKAKINIHLKVL